MRILITGGTGFLGRHCAWRLHGAGHRVTITGRNDRIGKELSTVGISYEPAALDDAERIIALTRDHEVVIHSGGLASPWGAYDTFFTANVLGTRNVLEGCRRHHVRRLVHLSTPSLYFDYRHRRGIRESDPLPKPSTPYAATKKLADDDVANAQARGLETISLRPRAIFGPGDQAVLVRVLRAAEHGRKIPLIGGGRSYLDLTYIDNIVDAVLLAIDAPKRALGHAFNITNAESITARRMIELLFRHLGREARFRPLPFPIAYSLAALVEAFYRVAKPKEEPPLTRYAVGLIAKDQTLDISSARELLGYTPRVDLETGMARFASWWLKREAGKLSAWEALGLPAKDGA